MKIFVAYSHKDRIELEKLNKHLKILVRSKVINSIWYDEFIVAGDDWNHKINSAIEQANIILLLVSSYFLDSDYCYEVEMQKALELHKLGKVRVIPIILKPCLWKLSPLSELQALPKDGIPIIDEFWKSEDFAYFNIAERIKESVEEMPESNYKADKLDEKNYYYERFMGLINEAESEFLNLNFKIAKSKYEESLNFYNNEFNPNKNEIAKRIEFCSNKLLNIDENENEVETDYGLVIRDGNDGIYNLRLSIIDACFGCDVEVPTIIDKKVKIRIPPGVQSGKIFRVRDRGFTSVLGETGDMLYVVDVFIPKYLSKEEKYILTMLKDSPNFDPRSNKDPDTIIRKLKGLL